MDEIIHEFDEEGCHRLIVNGSPGPWFVPNEFAVKDEYYSTATPDIGHVAFPPVFTITEIGALVLTSTQDRE